MNLVVVSNRVARANANEPMTGGLAAALLPVVENSGAIWVGSSGRVRDGHQKEPFAEIKFEQVARDEERRGGQAADDEHPAVSTALPQEPQNLNLNPETEHQETKPREKMHA